MKTPCRVLLLLMLATTARGQAPAGSAKASATVYVKIQGGSYRVGSPGHPLNPGRKVTVAPFEIADSEVTNAQFQQFTDATGYRTHAERRGKSQVFRHASREWQWVECAGANWRFPLGPEGGLQATNHPQHPVTQIAWEDADAFAKWAQARLPTQDEWEIAARGGVDTLYPWGDAFDVGKANIWNGRTHHRDTRLDGWEFTSPVRSFAPNKLGLYDVVGNVFEFVQDLPVTMAERKATGLISARGGSWWCSERTCQFYNLVSVGTMLPNASLPNQGFRIARNGSSLHSSR